MPKKSNWQCMLAKLYDGARIRNREFRYEKHLEKNAYCQKTLKGGQCKDLKILVSAGLEPTITSFTTKTENSR